MMPDGFAPREGVVLSHDRVVTKASVCIDADQYRRACGKFATGVAVATVMQDSGAATGLTISSFTSVSMEPPLILFCVHRNSRVLPHFRQSRGFGVNILSAGQTEISTYFARELSEPCCLVRWNHGGTGVPVLQGVSAVLECRLHSAVPGGDHEILVGEVLALSIGEGTPLVRYGGMYCSLEAPSVNRYETGKCDAERIRG
jgi:flavin reductase (DIM6/NTAB) family NADH-FMN oxidoreductase RutF